MASGVAISDEVVQYYNRIQVRHQSSDQKDMLKFMVMRLSEDQKSIIVDKNKCLTCEAVQKEADIFKKITSMLPSKECCYAVYDCKYESMESVKEDLVFISYAPEDAPVSSKMVYSSSKRALKAKLTGLKFEWQINDHTDKDVSSLVQTLGGPNKVKTVEGKPV